MDYPSEPVHDVSRWIIITRLHLIRAKGYAVIKSHTSDSNRADDIIQGRTATWDLIPTVQIRTNGQEIASDLQQPSSAAHSTPWRRAHQRAPPATPIKSEGLYTWNRRVRND